MTQQNESSPQTASDVADQLCNDLAPLEPKVADALGAAPSDLLPTLAPADFEARRDAYRRARRALAAIGQPRLGCVLGLALRERVDAKVAMDETGFTVAQLAPLGTAAHHVKDVFDRLPHDTDVEWERVAEHLMHVPTVLADYAESLRVAADNGHVSAARQVLALATQCERWILDDDFYRTLVAPSAEGLRGRLDIAAGVASDATLRFADFLRGELLPRAPRSDAAGADMYAVTARAFLGEDVDLADTYEFGWDELTQVTAEMRTAAAELGYDSIQAAAAALDAEPLRRLSTTEQLLSWLQGRVDQATDAVDGVHLDLPAVTRRAECRISAPTSGVMYYSPPSASFSRPGRVWWPPPARGVSHTWRDVTTVHHEGVPGHHLQVAVAMAEPGLHPWQRSLADVHGYVEGWAHYAERVADELGLLRDEGERLGMLFGQRWRAARIVIDMGLHLGLPIPANGFTTETRWTLPLAVEFLRKASGAGEAAARFEVDRYLGWPAQALAFRVGARGWREAREVAERQAGFDLRTFHMRALRLGPLGLGPLRQLMGTHPEQRGTPR